MGQAYQIKKTPFEKLGIVGESPAMYGLYEALTKIKTTESTILIRGESGTGKDLVARAIHSMSVRKDGPFVAVNCAALPESLVQSELFGHEKGAFTSAHRRKIGKFEAANGGTIFLDEIGDLSLEMQATLLRVIETRSVDVVGGESVDVDVRIITATHVNLEDAVRRGRFRDDLYYRLNVINLEVPPLRDRGDDVQLLADYFFEKYTTEATRGRLVGFSASSRVALRQWHWPGNVRELMNRVRKAVVLAEKGPLSRVDLGLERRTNSRQVMTLDDARDEAEVRAILAALDSSAGSMGMAADTLGVSRMTLYRLIKKHEIGNSVRGIPADMRA